MQVVTRDIKKVRKGFGRKPMTIRFLKRRANRLDRRACKIALRMKGEYVSVPRLTGRDIW